jgi:hypothetical protein
MDGTGMWFAGLLAFEAHFISSVAAAGAEIPLIAYQCPDCSQVGDT